MAIAKKTSLEMCIQAVSNFIVLLPSHSPRLKSVSKFRKRKRKLRYYVFVLHKRVLSCRSNAVTAKKCKKNRDARAKLL